MTEVHVVASTLVVTSSFSFAMDEEKSYPQIVPTCACAHSRPQNNFSGWLDKCPNETICPVIRVICTVTLVIFQKQVTDLRFAMVHYVLALTEQNYLNSFS